mmetsp:Transcript_175381/g.562625  ORF Transcript_175381/g.562625 Transcript_175381/m.562625 type:complete len:109 (-) Transcript_175381:3738-4064(-)
MRIASRDHLQSSIGKTATFKATSMSNELEGHTSRVSWSSGTSPSTDSAHAQPASLVMLVADACALKASNLRPNSNFTRADFARNHSETRFLRTHPHQCHDAANNGQRI